MDRLTRKLMAFLLCGGLLLQACSGDADETDRAIARIDSLQSVITKLQATTDSLQTAIDRTEPAGYDWYHNNYEGHKLVKQGIDDPETFIKEALSKRPELIPLKPVMGGKMRFTQMEVLGDQWVVAAYEDGHIMGKSLYRYQVNPDQSISFKVIESDRPLD